MFTMSKRMPAVVATVMTLSPMALRAQEAEGPPKTLVLRPLSDTAEGEPASKVTPRDPRDEAPRHAFVESPFNLSKGSLYAAGTGQVVPTEQKTLTSGGVRLGVSPLDRVSAHVLLGRNASNQWSPSATVHLRALGSLSQGFALGILASYKAEGFSELGGEGEIGVTAGYRSTHVYLDMNSVVGKGLEAEEEGETDGELRLRAGYTFSRGLRSGVEGQVRRRFSGKQLAPNGRQWDSYAGPQIVGAAGTFVIAATGGLTNATPEGRTGTFALLTISAFQQAW